MMTNTLAGRPINGKVSYYSDRDPVEQKPIQELLDALDGAFSYPEVEAIRWTQYTPYFNDGDPCTFDTHGVCVKYVGQDTGGDFTGRDGYYEVWGTYPSGYWQTHSHYSNKGQGFPPADPADKVVEAKVASVDRSHDIGKALAVVEHAIESGAFEADLYKAFGDPAEVTATREGFSVEHYDHY